MKFLRDLFKLVMLILPLMGEVYADDQEDRRDAYQIFLEAKEEENLHTFTHNC